MNIPAPAPGLVIRYSFLWSNQDARGVQEGAKDRPSAIVVAVPGAKSGARVLVAPITHSPPLDRKASLELPAETARALGLDGDRHWIRLDELNRFEWPGYDLRPIPGRDSCAYGMLPKPLFEEMRRLILALAAARRSRTQTRD